VVTINQSGNDPATIIKKPVLRFDGTNDGLQGLFANNIDGGYMFAAFSVLGDGGEAWGRVFSTNSSSGGEDDREPGAAFSIRSGSTADLHTRFKLATASLVHVAMFDAGNGDILHESKIQNGSQSSKVNNANLKTESHTITTASDKFNIGSYINPSLANTAIDLEYLALFSVDSVPDEATASKIRNYINNRNLVFLRHQTDGYYFYDAQKAPVGAISSGSSAWNGRIVGSDNGDTDKLATQSTSNDSPVGDGFKVTFADNTDHLDIPSTTQAGWQIVGTSLGTFVYRVDNDAVTELNLLGNAGAIRSIGDLYGIILLPASATGKDIEDARKLLIDRGAADGAVSHFSHTWFGRGDIVEFKHVDASSVTTAQAGWLNNYSLEVFPDLDLSNSNNFIQTWQNCSSLSSFPSGAKLGTSATNVSFTSAWQSSGLTSFPPLDLSTGTTFANSFTSSALTSFPDGIKMGTAATGDVQFTDTWRDTTLSSFPALDLGNGKFFNGAWRDCHELTSFPSDIKLGTNKTGVGFIDAWRGSGLTSFPALDLSTGTNFNQSFFQATSLQEFGQCDFSNGSSFDLCWYYCSALTTFPSMQLPSATSLNSTWMGCSSLTNFGKLEAPNVTVFRFTWSGSGITTIEDGTLLGTSASSVDFTSAFKNCTALTTLPSNLNLSKGDDFQTAFQNCQSLVDFPANAFDTMGTPQDYCFLNTWLDNNALSSASVENILVSINTSGQSAPSTGPEITIKYNTATGSLSATTNSAIDSLSGKGWQVIVNNVNLSLNNTYSVAFDGTDDYMSMTLPVLGNTHTLSAWFKTTASYGGPGSEGTLISYLSSGGGNDDSVLSVVTNKVGWSDFTDDDQYGTSTVNDGNWHQAVVVVTASTQKIYVDGVLETTTSNAYSAGTSFSSATIGRRANAAQRFFNGNIDEVAIWNSELSATDVTAIYNGGRPVNLNVNTNGYDNLSTLVAWWRMGDNDSGTGSTVTDNSANSYNGTLINGPTFQTNTP
jgi:hypothetical protein